MKHIKKVEIPATTREVVEYCTCDLCGDRLVTPGPYVVDDVEIRHRTGHQYPEGGMGEEVSVDMCSACFTKKLLPWLRDHGAEPNVEEWDW